MMGCKEEAEYKTKENIFEKRGLNSRQEEDLSFCNLHSVKLNKKWCFKHEQHIIVTKDKSFRVLT